MVQLVDNKTDVKMLKEKKSKILTSEVEGLRSGLKVKAKKTDQNSRLKSPKPSKVKKDKKIKKDNLLIDSNSNEVLSSPEKKKIKKKKVQSSSNEEMAPNKKKKLNDGSSIALLQDHIETPPMSDEDKTPAEKEGDFANFRITEETVALLRQKSISYLFPVQCKTFDHIYDGKDVVAQARTGTGKTLSFALPLVEKLQLQQNKKIPGRPPKVLVMAPTRELAIQVHRDFEAVTTSLKSCCVYGGTPYYAQEKAMRSGLDILVGTPGRILDHINKGNLVTSKVDHVVLDEVDRMLDMGFAPSVEEILQYSYHDEREQQPQTLLFSATCPPWVRQTAKKYMRSDSTMHIDLIGKDKVRTATTVQHLAIRCHYSQRSQCIGDVVQVYSGRHGRAMVFTETKRDANELGLSDALKVETQVLHGDIEQKQREITLKAFREGSVKCLVATNVAARGLDIPEVDLVIQINPPKDIESYIHRSGRTGRAGRLGTCICFYKPNEEELLRRVERQAGIQFKRTGPPQPKDIIQSSYDDAVKSLDSIPENVCEKFLDQAQLVSEKFAGGALEALAAALAHMSGATNLSSRSLLNAQEGATTWYMAASFPIRNAGFFYNVLDKEFGPDVRNGVKGLRLTKDKQGAVFDLPTDMTTVIESKWTDSDRLKLTKADTVPELLEDNRPGDRRGGSFGGGRAGRSTNDFQARRGFSFGRGRGNNRGLKRKWNNY